jgi:hypothetical protein
VFDIFHLARIFFTSRGLHVTRNKMEENANDFVNYIVVE